MDRNPWRAGLSGVRWTRTDDAERLAALYAVAWRYAYAGIIPGTALEGMISRRGPKWWRRLHAFGGRALAVEFDGGVAGYALVGRNRGGPGGEIQELYVRPECQGVGFGGSLFAAARAELAARAVAPLTVWCLAENRVGCAFYRAKGGVETAQSRDRIGGRDIEKRRFTWLDQAAA